MKKIRDDFSAKIRKEKLNARLSQSRQMKTDRINGLELLDRVWAQNSKREAFEMLKENNLIQEELASPRQTNINLSQFQCFENNNFTGTQNTCPSRPETQETIDTELQYTCFPFRENEVNRSVKRTNRMTLSYKNRSGEISSNGNTNPSLSDLDFDGSNLIGTFAKLPLQPLDQQLTVLNISLDATLNYKFSNNSTNRVEQILSEHKQDIINYFLGKKFAEKDLNDWKLEIRGYKESSKSTTPLTSERIINGLQSSIALLEQPPQIITIGECTRKMLLGQV